MNSIREKLLKKTFDDYIELMLYDFPVERIGDLIAEDVSGYGTTVDEKFLEIKRFKKVVTDQREQGAGIEMHFRITPIHRRVSPNEDTAIFMDEFELTMVIDGAKNVIPLRLTSVFEFQESNWKLVHIHGSKAVETEGDTWHMEEWKQKNEELQRLVDEKTADLAEKNRELEMEAALERVRTVAMSMHKPDDLLDVCQIISEQLEMLNINNIRNVQVAIINESKKSYSNYQFFAAYAKRAFEETRYENNPASKSMVQEMQKSANAFFIGSIIGEELDKFNAWRKEYGQFPDPIMDELTEVFYYFYSIGEGGLGLTTYQAINENELEIFKRFHLVFKLAYRRYMDIQQAEAQAREAQIEAALERIRSRALSMRNSAEVGDVSSLLFRELEKMDINPSGFSIMIFDKEQDKYELWRAKEVANQGVYETFSIKAMFDKLDQYVPGFSEKLKSSWTKGDPFFVGEFRDKKRVSFIQANREMANYSDDEFENMKRMFPDPIFWHLVFFKQGWLGILQNEQLPEDNLMVIHRFAEVFDFAFTRFLDLQKAENQALRAEEDLIAIKVARQKAEEALSELQTTQSQLIHAEKMASLGELTAGIAHEIQNPLNFVNNFAEVSIELIDEMKQESSVVSHQSSVIGQQHVLKAEPEGSANDIIDDIRQNLDKILHHGKRADAIVKGMLQHSRNSTGMKEPTDINALVDEYLRLAYHGLRAKDKTFNALLKTDFDDTIGNINIIPQDIGRVILNLITNAFYAVNEKKKKLAFDLSGLKTLTGQNHYEPTVSVITQKSGGNVLIYVKDNGNGIPEEIKNKIFQPFFTTKPTGQGTGLGLSLSYDIVKAHGGEINVESKEDEGTWFSIQLPLV